MLYIHVLHAVPSYVTVLLMLTHNSVREEEDTARLSDLLNDSFLYPSHKKKENRKPCGMEMPVALFIYNLSVKVSIEYSNRL